MPIFHFHTKNGECLLDEDGTPLPSLEDARRAAVEVLCETLHRAPGMFLSTQNFEVIVTDAAGDPVFRIHLETVPSPPKDGTAR